MGQAAAAPSAAANPDNPLANAGGIHDTLDMVQILRLAWPAPAKT